MRQVPPECDIIIAVNKCSGFKTSTQQGPLMAMLIARSRGTCLIIAYFNQLDVSRPPNTIFIFISTWSMLPVFNFYQHDTFFKEGALNRKKRE